MLKPVKFLTNKKGKTISVVLDIRDYERILVELEELEDIRAYDEAKLEKEKPIPFRHAMDEIKRTRR